MHVTKPIQLLTVTGTPVHREGMTVTPQSQALIVRVPNGGLVWHWPTAVLVERAGQVRRIPIVDVTRVVQVALLAVAGVMLAASLGRRPDGRKESRI